MSGSGACRDNLDSWLDDAENCPQADLQASGAVSGAKTGVQGDSGAGTSLPEPPATPETIRISLPALRALLFEALDDGDMPGGSDWLFYHWNTDIANDQRERFVDIVCEKYQKRLRQLPARG